jgi:pyridoxine 4-dehydrogenase
MQHTNQRPATASGTFPIGGDLTVYRLGFGTMRLTGPGIWGPPADKQEALAVLRHALDLGVNLPQCGEIPRLTLTLRDRKRSKREGERH